MSTVTAIRLRDDIARQLRHNSRPVIVDCLAGTRVVAQDRATWEFLRALDGAAGPADVVARLDGTTPAAAIDVSDVQQFLAGPGARWLVSDPANQTTHDDVALEKLRAMIDFARAKVPHYRRAFGNGSLEILDTGDLARLPLLTKDVLRQEFPTGLLAEGIDYGGLIRTGEAQVLYSSGTTLDGDRSPSLHLASEDELNQSSPFGIFDATERQARFSTPRCTGRECYIQQQSKADRTFGPNLILNSSADPMFMTDAALHDVASELSEWRPVVLSGNPWYLAVLLRFFAREGLELPESILAVLFGTELAPSPVQRYVAEQTGVIAFDNYSASEVGNIANTCPLGVHHVFDSVFVEVVRSGQPAPFGEVGEVVVSNLDRRSMPILRYRTGDLAVRLDSCGCALPHPALQVIGRISECLVDGDRLVTPKSLDEVAAAVDGLLFYRASQGADERVSLEVIARPDSRRDPAAIGADLADHAAVLGLTISDVKAVDRMHTRDSMKFSVVISKVRDQKERVLRALGHAAA